MLTPTQELSRVQLLARAQAFKQSHPVPYPEDYLGPESYDKAVTEWLMEFAEGEMGELRKEVELMLQAAQELNKSRGPSTSHALFTVALTLQDVLNIIDKTEKGGTGE